MHKITIPLFQQILYLITPIDIEKFCLKLSNMEKDFDEYTDGRSYYFPDKRIKFIMYVRDPSNKSTIIHESLHISIMLLDYVGIDPLNDWGEITCYLQTHIISEVEKKLKKIK